MSALPYQRPSPSKPQYRRSSLEVDGPLHSGVRLRVTDHLEDCGIEVPPNMEVVAETVALTDGEARLMLYVVERTDQQEARSDGGPARAS